MKRISLATGVISLLSVACLHTTTVSTSAGDVATHHAPDTGTLPGGAVLEGKLDHAITAATAHVGDAFSVTLSGDATTKRHATVVPAGTVLYGHVTQLDLSNASGSVATVQLAFDSLVVSGRQHLLDANITKLGADNVSIRPVDASHPADNALPASITLLSFANATGQIPAGSSVTLVVTNPIRLVSEEPANAPVSKP